MGVLRVPSNSSSSFATTVRVPSSNDSVTSTELDASIKITLPLRESSLPIDIISTTKIVPIYEDDADEWK